MLDIEKVLRYSNGEKKIINNYKVEDGVQLQAGQTSVTITYTENNITVKTTQPITVSSNGQISNGKIPKASSFDSANAFISNVNIDGNNNITGMTVDVSNIKIGDIDDKYTFYYCILGTSDSTAVKDSYWIEISSDKVNLKSDGTIDLSLDVKLNDQVNISELTQSNKIYLHLKEKAEINNQTIETLNVLHINSNVQDTSYVSKAQNVQSANDSTVANKILPKTGKVNLIIGIVLILGIGIFSYIRYKNIDR